MLVLQRLVSSSLVRSIAAVAGGSAVAQAVAFAFSPLITRIYNPEVFGLQGVFLSLISILGPVIALRYPMAIVIAEDEADAWRISRLSMLIAFALSVVLGLVLLVAQGPILTLMGAQALGSLILFMPLALFCVALQDITDYRAARHGRFRLVGVVTVAQAFLTNLARVLGGLIAPVAGVLMAITSIAPSIQAALMSVGDRHLSAPAPRPRLIEALILLKKHADFPLYRAPTDMLNAASQSVPVIMLAALFSPAAAGLYVLTRSVLNLPVNVIGVAVGNVLYAHYAQMARAGQPLAPQLLRATLGLLALSPFVIGAAWFAPSVFAFVFGEEWREAGRYAQWMVLWTGVSFANLPAVRLAPVIQAQMLLLVANVAILIVRVAVVLVAHRSGGGALFAVALFSVTSLISNVVLTAALIVAAMRHDRALADREP